jgi:acyl-coenzyme A thioesterase PaaI-like protein
MTCTAGLIGSVMDTAGAATAWSNHDFDKAMRASTVAMSIQHAGAATCCDLLCHARTARRRKELTFSEITATDADGHVVADAVQTYRIV